MTIDLSRVARLAERQAYEEHLKAVAPLLAERNRIAAPFSAERKAARATLRKAQDAAQQTYWDAIAEISERENEAAKPIDQKIEDAQEPPVGGDVMFDEDGEPERCCVSGLVLLDDDETIEDSDGRKALKALLPWPGDEDEEDDEDCDETDGDEVPA